MGLFSLLALVIALLAICLEQGYGQSPLNLRYPVPENLTDDNVHPAKLPDIQNELDNSPVPTHYKSIYTDRKPGEGLLKRLIREITAFKKKSKEVVEPRLESPVTTVLSIITGGRHVRQNPNSRPYNTDRLRIAVNMYNDQQRRPDLSQRPNIVHNNQVSVKPKETAITSFSTITLLTGASIAFVTVVVVVGIVCVYMAKKVKAAETVDYPAYGVTGPSKESPHDDRLARQAQRSHFRQHKGQIINMSRAASSISESDEEADLGDYTVYECPGLGATGTMEIKNPLFTDDAPMSPSICKVVKPQPVD